MDVKCCRHQHEVLVTYIRYVLQCWGPLDDLPMSYWIDGTVTPWMRSSPIATTPDLKRVLTRARILSEDCCIELPPLKAVLRHVDRSQEFADIVKEIQWCTSVVYNGNICRNVTERSSPELKDFPWQAKIGYQEKLFLEKAEQEDWQRLMQELKNYHAFPKIRWNLWRDLNPWKRNHKCSAEDCGNMHAQMDPSYCLVSQIMQRFFPQETGRSEPDHKSLLWTFDPEVLKHGRLLGSGSFGSVMEVMWLGSKYAQKKFNAIGLHSLPAEIEALVQLNHPHIVKVYAYSKDSLLMDLMCTDLHKFMKSRMKGGARAQPFSLPAAMDLMLQIADAVNYLHSQKVAHRDLKSSNILVNPVITPGLEENDGFVFAKIADFGVAKVKQEVTRYSHLTLNIGTRRWMAPEIFGANIEDNHLEHAFPMKADVYSFGIVCFEILTGQEPFGDEPLLTLYSKLTAPIPLRPLLPSSCPRNLASLICACWDADPQMWPAFGDVCRVLRYLKGLPTLIALSDPQSVAIDVEWPFGRLPAMINDWVRIFQKQALWGDYRNPLENKIVSTVDALADIRGVRFYKDLERDFVSGFGIVFNIRGQQYERTIGECLGRSSEWIYFHESEFLVQVEGRICWGFVVMSLSFITTRQKYSASTALKLEVFPNLEESVGEYFCSDHGRVVGFTDVSHATDFALLLSFEVHTIPNIVGCLRQYLGNDESIA